METFLVFYLSITGVATVVLALDAERRLGWSKVPLTALTALVLLWGLPVVLVVILSIAHAQRYRRWREVEYWGEAKAQEYVTWMYAHNARVREQRRARARKIVQAGG